MKNKMSIEGRLPQGYVVLCSGNGSEYTFLQRTLGLSVECPHCGATSEGATLALQFYLSKANSKMRESATVPAAAAGGSKASRRSS